MKRIYPRIFLASWLIFVFIISVYPFKEISEIPKNSDKVVHFLLYMFTASVVHISLRERIENITFFSVIFSSSYGVFMEYIQKIVPYRSFSIGDIISDIAGALSFGVIVWIVEFRKRK